MRRRETVPVVGLLSGVSFDGTVDQVAAVCQRLKETVLMDKTSQIEYRSAEAGPSSYRSAVDILPSGLLVHYKRD